MWSFLFKGLFTVHFFFCPSKCKSTVQYIFVFIYQGEHIVKFVIMNPFLIPASTQFPFLKQGRQRNFTFFIVHSFFLSFCPFPAYSKLSVSLGQVTEEVDLIDLFNYLYYYWLKSFMPEHTIVHDAEYGLVTFESQVHLILIQSVTISALRTFQYLLHKHWFVDRVDS